MNSHEKEEKKGKESFVNDWDLPIDYSFSVQDKNTQRNKNVPITAIPGLG